MKKQLLPIIKSTSFILFIFFHYHVYCQQQDYSYNKIFQTNYTDWNYYLTGMKEVNDGFIMGIISSSPDGGFYFTSEIQKTSKNFDTVYWNFQFNDTSTYYDEKLFFDLKTINEEGDFVVAGRYTVSSTCSYMLLMKFNRQGETVFEKTYSCDIFPDGFNTANNVFIGKNKSYLLTGTAGIAGLAIKVDSLGNKQWEYTMGNNTTDNYVYFRSGAILSDNSVVIGGCRYNGHKYFDGEAFVIKLDSTGNFLWKVSLGSYNRDEGTFVAVNENDEIYGVYEPYTETTWWGEATESKISVFKIDKNGNKLFDRRYGDNNIVYYPKSIVIGKNGDLIVTGERINLNGAWILRANTTCDSLWYRDYEPPLSQPIFYGFEGGFEMNSNELIAFGKAEIRNESYCWVVKTDSAGCFNALSISEQPDSMIIAHQNDTVILEIIANSSAPVTYQWYKNKTPISGATNSVFIIPSFTTDDEGLYYCILNNGCHTLTSNFIHVVAYNGFSENLRSNRLKISPNPARNNIEIISESPINSYADVVFYLPSGRKILTLKNISFSGNKAIVDISSLPPDIIFVTVSSKTCTEKAIFIKIR